MTAAPIVYKKLEPIHVAFIKTPIETREQIPPLFDHLRTVCGAAISGHAMVIFHGGAVKDGLLIEAAFPVAQPVETEEIHTRLLEAVPAITTMHYGEHKTIRESVLKIYAYIEKHAWSTSLIRREIYPVLNEAEPDKNIAEVQAVLHEWGPRATLSVLLHGLPAVGVEGSVYVLGGSGRAGAIENAGRVFSVEPFSP